MKCVSVIALLALILTVFFESAYGYRDAELFRDKRQAPAASTDSCKIDDCFGACKYYQDCLQVLNSASCCLPTNCNGKCKTA
uniref:Uncharacterized protein n=1 Tax=Acrobeloides nanus TaxID=290746 RepID=A0A914DUH0_9BILA